MGNTTTQETLALLKVAQTSPDSLIKSFVQPGNATTGLQAYNLQAPSKKLAPVLTPLRNKIPRVGGGYAVQASWKAITNLNAGNVRAGVSEGKRGGIVNHTLSEYFASFRGYGLENSVTFEANYAAQSFEDIKALAVEQTLQATMVQEERLILGGNTSLALGTTPTPTLTTAATGGTLAAGTWSVICVALGYQAYLDLVGVNNGSSGQYFDATVAQVPGQITRTNADGSTDSFGSGSAQKSANAILATTGAASTLSASVTPVIGAMGYAWFVGPAGSERLYGISSINSIVVTTAANGAAQFASSLPTSDSSTSALDFDGLLTQAFRPGSNAYVKVMNTGNAGVGTPLTSDGAGVYTFATADAGKQVFINYHYTATASSAKKISVQNLPMGYAPSFKAYMQTSFQGKKALVVMYQATSNKLSMFATKQDDFSVPEFDLSAQSDASNNVADIYVQE